MRFSSPAISTLTILSCSDHRRHRSDSSYLAELLLAKVYIEGMWRILRYHEANDWVLATGQANTVRNFVEAVFAKLDRDIVWIGNGLYKKSLDQHGKVIIEINERYFRPTEVPHLLRDSTKARTLLGWKPTLSLDGLIEDMLFNQNI
jgi:GDPmannose 4,6-dehydratase